MKPYSLNFYSDELEFTYKEQNSKIHRGVFVRNMAFYGLMAIFISAYSFFLG